MKCLKKVSLSKKIPADVQVALLNDKVKKQLFQKNTSATRKEEEPLLNRLWPGIEQFSKAKRQKAVRIIKKLDALPTFQINENLEMVYKGDVARGTNILQLIRCELYPPAERVLLSGQDLFHHALLTSPLSSKKVEPDSPTLYQTFKHNSLSAGKNRKKLKSTLLQPSSSARKVLKYSPKRLRSSTRHAPKTPPSFKERNWKT